MTMSGGNSNQEGDYVPSAGGNMNLLGLVFFFSRSFLLFFFRLVIPLAVLNDPTTPLGCPPPLTVG
jgi:hypothetical protein